MLLVLVGMICNSAGANLISYWKFDEGSGSIAYDSHGSNNGTINGPTWATGQFNGALNFDGINDYVDVPDDASLRFRQSDSFSICCWAKPAGGTSNKCIFSKYRTSSIHNVFGYLLFWSADTLSFRFGAESSFVGTTIADTGSSTAPAGEWYFVAGVYNNKDMKIYLDGQPAGNATFAYDTGSTVPNHNVTIGARGYDSTFDMYFTGEIDDVRIYNRTLTLEEIQQLYTGVMGNNAYNPNPLNGAADVNNTVVLCWTAGEKAASHDVYFGTGFNDVNNATTASSEYKGNHSLNANSYAPNLLEYGVTYYWRIDEINDVNTTKGFVWNFTTKSFSPPDGVEGIDPNVILGWAAGQDAVSYDIYFGSNFYDVDNATTSSFEYKGNQLINDRSYNPGSLQPGTTYYWRIDKIKDDESVTKGLVWNFTTALFPGFRNKAYNPQPPYGTEHTGTNVLLSWTAGQDAVSHNIYFGTNFENIYNATTASPEYKGNQSLNNSSYNPGPLQSGTTYHWRIDELNSDGNTSKGFFWNFTTDGGSIYSCSNGSIHPDYWKFYVPRMILIKTPGDVNHYRTNVINYLWPQTGWPGSKMPQSVMAVYDPDHGINNSGWYQGLDNLGLVARIDRIDVKMDHDIYGTDWHSYAYLLLPKTSVNRLLIFQMGHTDAVDGLLLAGGKETMDYFIEKGFSIMAFSMPLYGGNTPPSTDSRYAPPNHMHDYLPDVLGDSFIHVFVEPIVVGINYVESQYNFLDISMTGISGGGWTTHICAAIDPRIKSSFPTAGSLPLFFRQGTCDSGSQGDVEQEWPDLYGQQQRGLKIDGYNSAIGWLDLYIMGSYGEYRQQVHILNQNDSCCFWGVNYRTYEPYVHDAVEQLGKGAYSVYLDTTHYEHKISNNAITSVIYPELQENFVGRRADFTGEGRIDIDDLAVFGIAWLSNTGTANWNENCDLSHDGQITLLDLAEFAKYWLWQAD